ncbi:MAG: rRNA pseudouridine synthase [Deltaproteobacteria bacterium]|nr:rRNA pseudouridine synthase [Deltaproteobacteria bacterium]
MESSPAPLPGRVRLQKLLASAGFGSRRACEEFIKQGRVSVNGEDAKLGDSADPASDLVRLDGEKLIGEKLAYWIVNKPEGVITSVRDPEGRATILGLLPATGSRLFPVGRLDLGTSGLVLLTNDGGLTQRLLHPSLGNEREYRVTVKGCVEEKTFGRLRSGVHLEDGKTGRSDVSKIRVDPKSQTTTFSLVLTEGRKRQIRRSLLALGHPVKKLVRVRMGPLRLGRLARGQARPLRSDEVRALREHVAGLRPTPKKRGTPNRRSRARS